MLGHPDNVVQRYLTSDIDMAVYWHPEARDCVYQEAKEVVQQRKAGSAAVAALMAKYRDLGYPEHNGLSACYVLVRRHTPRIIEFNKVWWQEYSTGPKRDQLSFDFVRWNLGLEVIHLPGNLFRGTSSLFARDRHKRGKAEMSTHWKMAYGKMLLQSERRYLLNAAAELNLVFPNFTIVNIGIFRCASMYCLRAGAPTARLIGIDIKPCDVLVDPDLKAKFIIGDSQKVYTQVPGDIHLLFIDGDHSYTGVQADLKNWASKVPMGGIVVLHDYAPTPSSIVRQPKIVGVRRAADEWVKSNWERLPEVPGSLTAFRRLR